MRDVVVEKRPVDRLREIRRRPCLQGEPKGPEILARRDHDDWHMACQAVTSNALGKRDAIHMRHVDIEERKRESAILDLVPRLDAIPRLHDLPAECLQLGDAKRTENHIVIRKQDARTRSTFRSHLLLPKTTDN